MIDKLRKTVSRFIFFNRSYAYLGAFNMGVYVFLANFPGGITPALKAGGIQAVLSFLIAGYNIGLFEHLARRSIPLAILIPTLVTSTIATTIHYLNGTPELLNTWAVVAGLAVFRFSVLSKINLKYQTIEFVDLYRIFLKHQHREVKP